MGNQQIVWGEADLFRSLDIINPLRIDQNTFAGEKFDEFRTPIFALKGLYSIGNVGTWFSDVAIEPWYSPRFRSGVSNLISEGQYRLPNEERGCLDSNGNLIPFDIVKCSQGKRIFVPYRPGWIGHRRQQNPWSFLVAAGPTQKIAFDDGVCLTRECSPDVFGQRASMIFNLRKQMGEHYFQHNDLARARAAFEKAASFRLPKVYAFAVYKLFGAEERATLSCSLSSFWKLVPEPLTVVELFAVVVPAIVWVAGPAVKFQTPASTRFWALT